MVKNMCFCIYGLNLFAKFSVILGRSVMSVKIRNLSIKNKDALGLDKLHFMYFRIIKSAQLNWIAFIVTGCCLCFYNSHGSKAGFPLGVK